MILLTGATGSAGSFIANEFVRQQEPVRILVRNRAKATALEKVPTVQIVEGRRRSRHHDLGSPHGYGRNAMHIRRRLQGRRRSPRDQIFWLGRSAGYRIPFRSDAQGY